MLVNVLFVVLFAAAFAKRDASNYIVSFPKSGRTWLRLMIGYAMDEHYHLNAPPADILELELDKHAKKVGVSIPRVAVDHAKKALELVPRAEWELPSQFAGSRVVLLIRDPRDVFVSNWFEKKWRKMGLDKKQLDGEGFTAKELGEKTADCSWIQAGAGLANYLKKFPFQKDPYCDGDTGSCSCFHPDYTILDFMREPHGGFDTILEFSKFFWDNRHKMEDLLLVRYEDMHRTPVAELKRVLLYLGVNDIEDEVLRKAVDEAEFSKMREKEMADTFGWRLSARNKDDTATFKTREGKVGGFRDHFELKTIQMMEQQMRAILPLEFGYVEEDLK